MVKCGNGIVLGGDCSSGIPFILLLYVHLLFAPTKLLFKLDILDPLIISLIDCRAVVVGGLSILVLCL